MADTKNIAGHVSGASRVTEAGRLEEKSLPGEKSAAVKRVLMSHTLREKVLVAGAMITGIIAISYLVGIPQWMKQRRENRQWVVVNNLTPDRLIARCGKPLSDDTRDVYPVIARDMSYNEAPSGTVVLKFSRTAEESSDWVFMSMQEAESGRSLETPIEKITALGCLDSRK